MNNSEQVLIKAENLKKYFPQKSFFGLKTNYVKAVDGVDLAIRRGETFGLVGESGCGKSTLGRTLIQMIEPTSGKVFYEGKEMTYKQSLSGPSGQNKMQIIFQDPYSALNPHWTVEEILEEAVLNSEMQAAERKERKLHLLEKVGLHDEDLQKFPHEFSGGQRQRIGIARALMVNPDFVFCDEPIAALDVSIQAQVVNLLEDIQDEFSLTYLFAAHDLSMVRYISDRIAVMYLGKIMELTESKTLYDNPKHPYTAALLSAIPVADPKLAREQSRIHLTGEIPSPLEERKGCVFASRCPYATEACLETSPELREIEAGHWVACLLAK